MNGGSLKLASGSFVIVMMAFALGWSSVVGAQASDADGDGFTSAEGDCNDRDGSVSPVAPEVSGDRIDSNCDGRDFGFQVGRPASIYRLYAAYFLRDPEPGGWNFWLGSSWNLRRMSDFFSQSEEFQRRYGALSDAEFVDLIYRNVLGRSAEPGGRQFWEEELRSGRRSRGEVMIGFSESVEFADRTRSARPVGQPSPTLLATNRPTDFGGCSEASGQPAVSGGLYGASITCRMDNSETDSVDYSLGRAFDGVTMTIGQSDQSQSDGKVVRFNVYADSRRIFSQDLPYGTAREVTLDVRNVLSLRLEAVDLTGGFEDVDAVFGSVAAWPTKDSIVYPGTPTTGDFVEALSVIGERVSSRCGGVTAEQKANGLLFGSSLRCRLDNGETGHAEYILGRDYESFTTTLGIGDSSDDDKDVEFSIYGDGRLLAERVVTYGQLARVEVDVTGVLRLRVEAVDLQGGFADVEPIFGAAVVWAETESASILQGTATVPSAELLLTSLPTIESSGCSSRKGQPALINGTSFDHSMGCTLDNNETRSSDFVIDRQYRSLRMTIGVLDSSEQSKRVRYNFYGDGRLLGSWEVGYAQSVPIDLNVDGVLRLRLEAVDLTGGFADVFPTFGTPVLRP